MEWVRSPEPVTIPRSIPEVQDVHMLVSWFPFQLNGMYRELGGRAARGELNESEAALDFLEMILAESDREQPVSTEFPRDGLRCVEAVGTKDGRRTRYICWPTPSWYGWNKSPTPVALVRAALKISGGEISAHGVLTPESCLDPLPFFNEITRQM